MGVAQLFSTFLYSTRLYISRNKRKRKEADYVFIYQCCLSLLYSNRIVSPHIYIDIKQIGRLRTIKRNVAVQYVNHYAKTTSLQIVIVKKNKLAHNPTAVIIKPTNQPTNQLPIFITSANVFFMLNLQNNFNSVDWGCRIRRLNLCRGITPLVQ